MNYLCTFKTHLEKTIFQQWVFEIYNVKYTTNREKNASHFNLVCFINILYKLAITIQSLPSPREE